MSKRIYLRLTGTALTAVPIASAPLTIASTTEDHASSTRSFLFRLRALFPWLARTVAPLLQSAIRERELQVMELQQLGEKRFVAVLRAGERKFLIGGANHSVSLLAELEQHGRAIQRPLAKVSR